MGKYRCPWCGEKTLTIFQKSSRRTHDFGLSNVKNKVLFSCPSCNKEIEHKISAKGRNNRHTLGKFTA